MRNSSLTTTHITGFVGAALGALLVIATTFHFGERPWLSVIFAAYGLLPYAFILGGSRLASNAWVIGGAAAAAIAVDAGIRASVFLYPRGSTAAVALVFAPVFLTVVVLPVGAIVGWGLSHVWRWGGVATRFSAVVVSLMVALGTVVGLARPELTPTAVFRRHAALRRIGPPRVIAGASAFESLHVSVGAAWYQVGRFDDRPGETIAVIRGAEAVLLDPNDFHERSRISFSHELARQWNSSTRLARLGGRLVAVRTGGGYTDTEVRTLDGVLLWRFRPSADLPAVALLPADLDSDGQEEFYGSNGDFIARLDANGHEVWRRPAHYPASLVLSGPRTPTTPAWVAALQNDRITVWDEAGSLLAELSNGHRGRIMIVDWPIRRTLLRGAETARGLGLDGAQIFDIPLGDFHFVDAVTVRFSPSRPSNLAIVAAAPRDVARWRVAVLAPDGVPVYDEVLDHWPRLLVARRSDGSEVLLIAEDGLRALRLR
jgi:hypothetical protein